MAEQLTAVVSASATKKGRTSTISAKPPSELSTLDGSPLTPQDETMLAILAELRGQGYNFRIVNLNTADRQKTAAVILTGRVWK